jgi:predicted aconitase with swiveling domain
VVAVAAHMTIAISAQAVLAVAALVVVIQLVQKIMESLEQLTQVAQVAVDREQLAQVHHLSVVTAALVL